MQTINMLETIQYFLKSNDVPNALSLLETNLEVITPYLDFPEDLIESILNGSVQLSPEHYLLLSKMFLLRKDNEKCVQVALLCYENNTKLLLNDGSFYNKAILFKMLEIYVQCITQNKQTSYQKKLKKLIKAFVDNTSPTLSLIGYLLETRDYKTAEEKLVALMKTQPIDKEVLNFLQLLKTIHSSTYKNVLATIASCKSLKLCNKLNYLILDTFTSAQETAEYLVSLKYPENYYGAFYVCNRYQSDRRLAEDVARAISDSNTNLQLILKGKINQAFVDFMVMNNQTNFKLLEAMGKSGCPYYGFCNSIMNAHTTNDSFFRTNRFNRSQDWNRFIEMGGLGLVHTNQPFEILSEILPSNSYTGEASALLSLGIITHLSSSLYMTTDSSGVKEASEFLNNFIECESETYLFGGCMGAATLKFGSGDEETYSRLRDLFSKYSTLSQETAAYSIGMLFAGTGDISVIDHLIAVRDSTDFVRVKRALNLSLAMISSNSSLNDAGSSGNSTNNITTNNKELKILSLGIKYTNTGNLKVIAELLKYVNDGVDDIKRQAAIALCSVIGYNQKLLEEIVIPLATSHSLWVRSAVAVCLGFFSTEITGELKQTIICLLEAMMYDLEDLVKNSACMGIGFALMQHSVLESNFNGTKNDTKDTTKNDTNNSISVTKRILTKINHMISSRNEPKCSKIGAALGRSIMELGGRSAIASLRNISGNIDPIRVSSFFLFMHSWYWNPMYNYLSLLVLPTPVYCYNSDLGIEKSTKLKVHYKELQVFIQENKRSRKFKRVKNEIIGDEIREVDKELESQEKINYVDLDKNNMINGIMFFNPDQE